MNKTILVTGGYGFLGQYLIRDILREFPQVRIKILDKKLPPKPLFDFDGHGRVTKIFKDICDLSAIQGEFAGIDLVIHLAGLVSSAWIDRKRLFKVNTGGTENILKVMEAHHVGQLIHISSVAALGFNDDKQHPIDEEFHFDWKIARKRKKFYMLSKHLGDEAVGRYIRKGLKAVILHPSLMFGPGDLTNSSRLIMACKQGKIPFNMPGGTSVIHVADVSRGIVAVLKKGVTQGRYLLSGFNYSLREINSILAECLQVKSPGLAMPGFLHTFLFHLFLFFEWVSRKRLPLTADDMDNAFRYRYYNNAKAGIELDWQPVVSFAQTINETIKWMKAHDVFKG